MTRCELGTRGGALWHAVRGCGTNCLYPARGRGILCLFDNYIYKAKRHSVDRAVTFLASYT